jgi:hypothetical protein
LIHIKVLSGLLRDDSSVILAVDRVQKISVIPRGIGALGYTIRGRQRTAF